MPPKQKFTDAEFLALYSQGLNDREISAALGMSKTPVRKRRQRMGLPANYVPEPTNLRPAKDVFTPAQWQREKRRMAYMVMGW